MPNQNYSSLDNKRVYVRELKERFHFEQLCGNEQSLERYIIAPDINRPGRELSGYLGSSDLKRVVIIGNKEGKYINQFDYETQKARFEIITDAYTPCIIISSRHGVPQALIDLANYRNFPIFKYEGETYRLTVDLVSFLAEKLADTTCVHGVMMNVYGTGVLIMGNSGIGKSELALALIKKGHRLIADDRVDISNVAGRLICEAPELLKRYMEIRGLGIVNVNYMFGGSAYMEKSNLDLVIKLLPMAETGDVDRLDPHNDSFSILGVDVPLLKIPVTESKSLSTIVEAAVTNFELKSMGIDANQMFCNQVYDKIVEKNGEKNK